MIAQDSKTPAVTPATNPAVAPAAQPAIAQPVKDEAAKVEAATKK